MATASPPAWTWVQAAQEQGALVGSWPGAQNQHGEKPRSFGTESVHTRRDPGQPPGPAVFDVKPAKLDDRRVSVTQGRGCARHPNVRALGLSRCYWMKRYFKRCQ